MLNQRQVYRYQVVRYDPEIVNTINSIGKTLGKMGVCIGVLGVGGYFLAKKVNELSKDVKKLKER